MKFWLALLLLTSTAAYAADSAEENSSTALFDWNRVTEKVNANYSALFVGPYLHQMDGDLDGKGTYLSLRNYFSLGLEVAKDWEVQTGLEVRRYWRPVDPKNPSRKDLDPRDPYLAVSRRNIVRLGNFSLGAKARFFIPVSNYTKSQIGRTYDAGKGSLNVSVSPYWSFLDGDLGISCSTEMYYNFDKRAAANRENYSVKAKPLVSYRIARKFAAKVEYNTGTIRHSENGKWSKLNDPFLGQKLYAGVTYYPTSALSLNPSLGWGSDTFRLNHAEVSLFASYNFL